MSDATDNNNSHEQSHEQSHKHKKVYFGVPAVGFFREKQPDHNHHKEEHEQHHDETSPLIWQGDTDTKNRKIEDATASRKGVTFQLDDVEIAGASSEDDDDSDDEESSRMFRRASSVGSQESRTKRTGKELWAILRRSVLRQDFHIRDTVRDMTVFQSINPATNRAAAVRFRDIDLPYDFSLADCLMMLLAYLAVSVIAFSFVFEQWTMIDSMYFAVVTFTSKLLARKGALTLTINGYTKLTSFYVQPSYRIR